MKKLLVATVLSFLLSNSAWAGGVCYSPSEVRAEQLLRLHSELMVITVTCHTGTQGENLIPAYSGFTRTNIKMLHDAEQVMVRYYQALGADGIAKLDTLRTQLANEFGQKSANITAPAFCSQYRDKVLAFNVADSRQIQDTVNRMVVSERSYMPACDQEAQLTTKK